MNVAEPQRSRLLYGLIGRRWTARSGRSPRAPSLTGGEDPEGSFPASRLHLWSARLGHERPLLRDHLASAHLRTRSQPFGTFPKIRSPSLRANVS